MEWKERIAWVSLVAATLGTYVIFYYGRQLAHEGRARALALIPLALSLITASAAGVMGMLLAKVVPLR